MIKAIFFDLDDTLLWDQKSIKEAFAGTCRIAADRYCLDSEQLEAAVRESAKNLYSSYEFYPFTQRIGINPFEGLWGNFLDKNDINFIKMKETVPAYRKDAWTAGLLKMGIDNPEFGAELAERFPEERRKLPFVYEETFGVLDSLKGRFQLLLLTNGSPDLQNTKLSITPELVPYFDRILISGDFGRGKPDASLFEHALSLLSINNNEAIMVGDNLMTDILGANRAGIRSVWVNRHNKPGNEIVPSYEIKHLLDLYPILEELNRK